MSIWDRDYMKRQSGDSPSFDSEEKLEGLLSKGGLFFKGFVVLVVVLLVLGLLGSFL